MKSGRIMVFSGIFIAMGSLFVTIAVAESCIAAIGACAFLTALIGGIALFSYGIDRW